MTETASESELRAVQQKVNQLDQDLHNMALLIIENKNLAEYTQKQLSKFEKRLDKTGSTNMPMQQSKLDSQRGGGEIQADEEHMVNRKARRLSAVALMTQANKIEKKVGEATILP